MSRKTRWCEIAWAAAAFWALAACGVSTLDPAPVPLDAEPEADPDPDPSDAGSNVTDAQTGSEGSVFSCSVKAPTACPNPAPRYADVLPIFQQRCTGCHSGVADGPWPLTEYEHIADWQDIIRGAMIDCSMPPPDAGVPMTNDERLAILTWIRCALPP